MLEIAYRRGDQSAAWRPRLEVGGAAREIVRIPAKQMDAVSPLGKAPRDCPSDSTGSPHDNDLQRHRLPAKQTDGLCAADLPVRIPRPADRQEPIKPRFHHAEVFGASERILREVDAPALGNDLFVHAV